MSVIGHASGIGLVDSVARGWTPFSVTWGRKIGMVGDALGNVVPTRCFTISL
jgi:hypothetical protein